MLFLKLSKIFMTKAHLRQLNFSSVISICGIAMGIAAYLIVVTVFQSFKNELKSIVTSANPHLLIYSPEGIYPDEKLKHYILNKLATPVTQFNYFVYEEAILIAKNQTAAVFIRALENNANPFSFVNSNSVVKPTTAFQELKSDPNTIPMIIGSELSEKLKVKVGDTLLLNHFTKDSSQASYLQYKTVKVVGTFSVGLSYYDQSFAYMPYENALQSFAPNKVPTGIEINFANPNYAHQAKEILTPLLPINISSWEDTYNSLFSQVERDGLAVKLIVLIISAVAAFNILVTLGLTVADRSRHIAILRALGTTRKDILFSVLFAGLVLGFLGATVGILMGCFFLKIFSLFSLGELKSFYFVSKIPVEYDINIMLQAYLSAIFLSIIGSFYPAWRAASISPLQGISQHS